MYLVYFMGIYIVQEWIAYIHGVMFAALAWFIDNIHVYIARISTCYY